MMANGTGPAPDAPQNGPLPQTPNHPALPATIAAGGGCVNLETVTKITGAILGILGLFFTAYTIYETNKTLIFTTEQNLYKESREILKFIAENPAIMEPATPDDISKLDRKERLKRQAQIGILLSFYESILTEGNAPYVSADFRKSLIEDFCQLVKFPQININFSERRDQPYTALANIKRSKCHA
jgi:hypothetical protein